MNYLGANMKLIVECSQKLVRLGENLWGKEQELDKEMQEHQKLCDEIMAIQGIEPIEAEMEQIIHCPEGYQFKDENGNAISATKIVLEKKKKEYPKTYKECCEVLGIGSYFEPKIRNATTEECQKFTKLIRLKRCRDAYWKLAGEEMGLGKPWKPDYDSGVDKFGIVYFDNTIMRTGALHRWERHLNKVLEFPTEEMRDAFKENFKEEIETCKELL